MHESVLFLRKDGTKFYCDDPGLPYTFRVHQYTKEFETYARRIHGNWTVWYEEV